MRVACSPVSLPAQRSASPLWGRPVGFGVRNPEYFPPVALLTLVPTLGRPLWGPCKPGSRACVADGPPCGPRCALCVQVACSPRPTPHAEAAPKWVCVSFIFLIPLTFLPNALINKKWKGGGG